MSQVKYNRLSSADSGLEGDSSFAIDFRSPFSYKSVYTYSKSAAPYIGEERDYKPSLLTKICSWTVIFISYFILFITFPVSGWFAIKFVQQFERIVVFRLGRLQPPRGPGIVLVVPVVDIWKRVDLRVRAFNVPPQQLLTTDGTALNIGATVYFRITDAILSVASIQDLNHSVRILGQTVMMNLLCSRTKNEIENDKQYICTYMQEEMNAATQSWGVEVSRVELSETTVLFEPPDQHFNKVTGLLGQLAQQLGGGGAALPSLLQPKLIPPGEDTKPPTSTTFEALPPLSPEELMDSVRQIIDVQLVRDVGAIYLFKITGEKGGVYFLDLKIGLGEVGRGAPPYCEPDIVLTTTLHDLQSMLHGQLKPYAAYMSGRLKVDGDLRTAMLLEEVVKRLKAAKERNSPEEWVQLGAVVGHIPEK
ncbi:Stomatin-like protein 1 [Holothuria leucospilota]|uniref:Stomatin-like protein 1 n=1 Tax=Holothuria leucospilota TaxID=206669 RepID=A0A9Q1BES3_HOLLE|nr:Stomatin-like protein 1 [Holothuria leucospilota]